MIKVNLNYNRVDSQSNKKVIPNFLDGRDASIIFEGEDDGIYYIKNYKKDQLKVISSNDTIESLQKDGFKVSEDNFYINNVLLKRSELDDIYIVKPLDTLDKISKLLNLEKEIIIKLNDLKSEKLFIGQHLKIMI